jgi:hypothetical protein
MGKGPQRLDDGIGTAMLAASLQRLTQDGRVLGDRMDNDLGTSLALPRPFLQKASIKEADPAATSQARRRNDSGHLASSEKFISDRLAKVVTAMGTYLSQGFEARGGIIWDGRRNLDIE